MAVKQGGGAKNNTLLIVDPNRSNLITDNFKVSKYLMFIAMMEIIIK